MAKPLTTQMKKAKVKKLMRNISDKFDEIKSLGGQAIFFMVKGDKTYLYGTKDLVKAPTFAPNIEKFSTDLLNHCSDESDGAFKWKSVRFSYKKLDEGEIHVVGLPKGVALKRPARLSSATIRNILSKSHLFHVEGVFKWKSVRFSYKKLDEGEIRVVSLPKGVALKRPASLSSATIRNILSKSHLFHVEGAFKWKSVRFSYKKLDEGEIRVVSLPKGVALKRPASLSSATIRNILSMSHIFHVEVP
ncbi:hypothetical protein CAPTEDRAFT_221214 [Capitella teleta]|uniref:Uncharacterized protein n=1 Tax=Capitella teleta TaxID=283909 RepID=R7T6A0_CAPTE|nr:hypothetical protein CAPTEDRAFT_221214 [Capitella teleta]|eukprot:ELT88798.1 hypothetical protein CAPTEDRAFT_221214 [Capitella teleta]